MAQGTLVYDGQSYPMQFKVFPNGFQFNQIGTGNLTVAAGNEWSGNYPSALVAADSNGYLWVWPNEQFSMVSTTVQGQSTGGTTGGTTGGIIPGLTNTELIIIVGVVAAIILAYFFLRKKS